MKFLKMYWLFFQCDKFLLKSEINYGKNFKLDLILINYIYYESYFFILIYCFTQTYKKIIRFVF